MTGTETPDARRQRRRLGVDLTATAIAAAVLIVVLATGVGGILTFAAVTVAGPVAVLFGVAGVQALWWRPRTPAAASTERVVRSVLPAARVLAWVFTAAAVVAVVLVVAR